MLALGFVPLWLPIRPLGLIHLQAAAEFFGLALVGQFQRLGLPLDGLGKLAAFGVGRRQGVEHAGIFPVRQLAGAGRMLQTLLPVTKPVLTTRGQMPGEGIVCPGIRRSEADRLGKIFSCLDRLSGARISQTARDVSLSILGLSTDCFARIANRLVEFLLLVIKLGPLSEWLGVLGIALDGFLEIRQCLGRISQIAIGHCPSTVGASVVQVGLYGSLEIPQ